MVSYYVSGSSFYKKYTNHSHNIQINGEILKGWDVVRKGLKRRPSSEEIKNWEKKLRIPSLWPAVVADRRMIYGKDCKVRQDYKSRYSLSKLQGITIELLESLWSSFETTRPEIILSFSPATVGAQIAELVAKAQGIPTLNLKSMKISNYVTLSEDFYERHNHIRSRYLDYLNKTILNDEVSKAALGYLASAKMKSAVYEGSLIPQKDSLHKLIIRLLIGFPKAIIRDLIFSMSAEKHDPHYQRRVQSLWHGGLGKRLKIYRAKQFLSPITLSHSELLNTPYVFFPFNSEPEIALSVYSRFTLNQIEVIRNISQSVSLGTLVVVKEHPRSWGLRSMGYYRRLSEIPNVRIVPVETPTNEVIRHAKATIVISSFVGFESVLQGVPVVALGNCSYDMLPKTMVCTIKCYDDLPETLQYMSINYKMDEQALLSYVSAVIHESIPIDLYTRMLGKRGRQLGTNSSNMSSIEQQYEGMALYFKRRFDNVSKIVFSNKKI